MSIKWPAIGSGVILLLAIFDWPYGYFVFLRWAIFVSAAVFAWSFYKSKVSSWALIFGAVAFLFNPIFPIYLSKETWVPIDFIVASIFFYAGFLEKEKIGNESLELSKGMVAEADSAEIKNDNFLKRFYHKHESYFTGVYSVAFVIGYIWAGITLLKDIFDSIRDGNFVAFVISIVLSSIIMMFRGLLTGIVLGTISAVVLFLPYLVVRGLRK